MAMEKRKLSGRPLDIARGRHYLVDLFGVDGDKLRDRPMLMRMLRTALKKERFWVIKEAGSHKFTGGGEGVTGDDVDDVAFIRALMDSLGKAHHTDPNQVFVCGHSAGAYMTYRLAVDLADLV